MTRTNPIHDDDGRDRTTIHPRTDALAEALGADPDELREALARAGNGWEEIDREDRDETPHGGTIAVPRIPSVSDAELIKTLGTPVNLGPRRVESIGVTPGDPQHGAMMSDSHVGRYDVTFRLQESDACPECGGRRAVRKYRRNHNIAGSDVTICRTCTEQLAGVDWS